MYQYERYRSLHKKKELSLKAAITHTHCSKKEFFLASFVDFSVFFLIPPIFLSSLIPNEWHELSGYEEFFIVLISWMIFAVITNVIVMFINPKFAITYTSPGTLLFGIQYANQLTGELLDGNFKKRNFFDFMFTKWKYNDNYEALALLFSDENQSPSMKEHGIIVVKKRIYKLFLEDYTIDGDLKGAFIKQLENEGFLPNHSQIFKDSKY